MEEPRPHYQKRTSTNSVRRPKLDKRKSAPIFRSISSSDVLYNRIPQDALAQLSGEEPGVNPWTMFLLTICMAGVQFTWTVELSYGTPFLLKLGLPKELTALVWLAGPLSGLVVQPLIGAFSDKSTSRFGRRRPFIIAGGILVITAMICVAFAREISAWSIGQKLHDIEQGDVSEGVRKQFRDTAILIAVFGFYFLDFSLNAVQASCRALILDVPPLWQQGSGNAWAGNMNNIGMVLGYFVGFMDLVRFVPFLGNTQMKALCSVASIVLGVTLGVTCISIHEKPYKLEEVDNRPWYYMLSYIWRALRYLPRPVQRLCNVQFFAWMGWFPFLFYATTWVAEILSYSEPSDSPDFIDNATRAGSFALLCHAIISVAAIVMLPHLVPESRTSASPFTMQNIYTASHILFGAAMLSTFFVRTVQAATAVIAVLGVAWGITMWVPFALVGEFVSDEEVKLQEDEEDEEAEARPLLASLPPPPLPPPYNSISDTRENDQERRDEEFDAGMILGVHNMYIVFPQFAVAIIASLIFTIVGAAQGKGGENGEPLRTNGGGVGWVLRFGGVMAFMAAFLSRYLIEMKLPRK
ncbi:uncharacterized protein VTP21DRAFT_2117 [Calcarisporiella thermophila]|uniref:uncharacterized protein n=1 Tax=Calcarisporiella thermophila TaxID=911321 RepID=UPI0037438026